LVLYADDDADPRLRIGSDREPKYLI